MKKPIFQIYLKLIQWCNVNSPKTNNNKSHIVSYHIHYTPNESNSASPSWLFVRTQMNLRLKIGTHWGLKSERKIWKLIPNISVYIQLIWTFSMRKSYSESPWGTNHWLWFLLTSEWYLASTTFVTLITTQLTCRMALVLTIISLFLLFLIFGSSKIISLRVWTVIFFLFYLVYLLCLLILLIKDSIFTQFYLLFSLLFNYSCPHFFFTTLSCPTHPHFPHSIPLYCLHACSLMGTCSMGTLYMFLDDPSPSFLSYPLWLLSVCSLFPCLWFCFAYLFVLLIRFHL